MSASEMNILEKQCPVCAESTDEQNRNGKNPRHQPIRSEPTGMRHHAEDLIKSCFSDNEVL